MASIMKAAHGGNRTDAPVGVDWALYAARCGWPVLPIVPGRKIPYGAEATATALGVDPSGPAGVHHARSDEASIRALFSGDRANALVGLAMGDGRLAIDVDERHDKSGSASMAANGWTIPPTASQRTPSGGWHYVLTVPPGQSAPTDTLADGLDRRGEGGHIVLYDGAILTAEQGKAPVWSTAGRIGASDRIARDDAARAPTHELARAALWSRHPSEMERSEWLAMSGAYYTATAGLVDDADALADWLEWNAQHGPTNDPAANRRTWSGFIRSGTAGDWSTLARMGEDVNAKGWAAFGRPLIALPAVPMPANDTARRSIDAGGFFIRVADMVPRPPVFLIDRLLEQDALASLFGDPASGKSLVAIEMAGCISKGEPFHGHAVRSGAVFYIAGEGKNGLRRRFAAWEELRGVSIADAPLFASTAAIQLLDAESAAMVTTAIDGLAGQHGTPRLIVIDTLARNFGPGDENSTADMNTFVAALDRLRERYPGATVLLVHHSGHGEKSRGRGSSVLRGAVDAEYRVGKKGEMVVLSNSKMKDAPPPPAMQFELVEAAGSVALEYSGEPGASGGGLSPNDRTGLDAFQAVAINGAASDDDWRAEFYDRMGSEMKNDSKKRAYLRTRTRLVDGKYLQSANDGQSYKLAPMPGQMPDR